MAHGRIVVIGDLNGCVDALRAILRALGLVATRDRWTGGDSHVVQLGDVLNRGDGAREAIELLVRLAPRAKAAGGSVTMLLGNHEVLTMLGNEAYCTEAEYLSFATPRQRAAWRRRLERGVVEVYRDFEAGGPIEPLEPRLAVWRIRNVPGRKEMRHALGPRGRLGRYLRTCPVALRVGSLVLAHSVIEPRYARGGVAAINALAAREWQVAPSFFEHLPRRSLFRDVRGPLWNRRIAVGGGPAIEAEVTRSLRLLGAERMVVGHTQTARVPGGSFGRIATRFDGRVVFVDVGLGSEGVLSALVVDGPTGWEWTPSGGHVLWRDG